MAQEIADTVVRREPIDLAPYQTELERMRKEYGARICALITEPYLGGGGSFHPQKEYIQLLARFCRDNDIPIVVFDVSTPGNVRCVLEGQRVGTLVT